MNENKKNALVIGGTGILGIPLVSQLISHGEYNVHYISLDVAEDPKFPDSVIPHIVNRNTGGYVEQIKELNLKIGIWDAVIDLIAFDDKSSEQTRNLFKDCAKHIITISTTLVYDRDIQSASAITEETPLAQEGKFGGYVDGKLKLEKFWLADQSTNWTLLRPYHILGMHSLLGCTPYHNRDPKLIERLKNAEPLELCNGGEIAFNYIHPNDIAKAIYKIIGNAKTFRNAYNLVNPQPILVKDYYLEIAHQVGGKLEIKNISIIKIWEEKKGWEMTTLPHVYSMEKMSRDIGFVPELPLSEGVRDAINRPPKVTGTIEEIPIHQRMNKLPRPSTPVWL